MRRVAFGMPDDNRVRRSLRWTLLPSLLLVVGGSIAAYGGWLDAQTCTWLRIPGIDKVLHTLSFGSLAFGAHFVFRGRRVVAGRIPLAIAVPAGLAALEELAQLGSPRRTADPLDLVCDIVGMVLFARLAERVAARRRVRGNGRVSPRTTAATPFAGDTPSRTP
jgi:VanZ family protein